MSVTGTTVGSLEELLEKVTDRNIESLMFSDHPLIIKLNVVQVGVEGLSPNVSRTETSRKSFLPRTTFILANKFTRKYRGNIYVLVNSFSCSFYEVVSSFYIFSF